MTKLLTEQLEQKFGKISVIVTKQNSRIRLSHLVDDLGITRTYAITNYAPNIPSELSKAHKKIMSGSLIGKTLKEHGFEVEKTYFDSSIITLSDWLKDSFRTDLNTAFSRSYEIYGVKNKPLLYGLITEIYSPNFINPDEIHSKILRIRKNNRDYLKNNPSSVLLVDE